MWGGLGATHWNWRPDVAEVVHQVERKFPTVKANTYTNHPWVGWDRQSVDFWGLGGRGDPIDYRDGLAVRAYLMGLPGAPHIRHTIYMNKLWTSWGGYSYWAPMDHRGWLRHLHLSYW